MVRRIVADVVGLAFAWATATAPVAAATWFMDNVGSGAAKDKMAQLDPQTAHRVGDALRDTFVTALSTSLKLSASVAAVGVAIAILTIQGKPLRRRVPREVAAAAAAVD